MGRNNSSALLYVLVLLSISGRLYEAVVQGTFIPGVYLLTFGDDTISRDLCTQEMETASEDWTSSECEKSMCNSGISSCRRKIIYFNYKPNAGTLLRSG
jgi:hypothetical protein